MKILLTIFKYFPGGGLQLDFLETARELAKRGHQITVFTRSFRGETPDFPIRIVCQEVSGWSNHRKAWNFNTALGKFVKQHTFDLVLGFNRTGYLDFCFAGDECFAARAEKRSWLYQRSSRCRIFRQLEDMVFSRKSQCRIFTLTQRQEEDFTRIYGVRQDRFFRLPPMLLPERQRPENWNEIREQFRQNELHVGKDKIIWLAIAGAFRTKGVDRTLAALAAMDEMLRKKIVLAVVGNGEIQAFRKLAQQYKISHQVIFTGGRKDVLQFLLASDLLVHPARNEAAGTVLIEALANGLPVVTGKTAGYAAIIEEARGGVVLPEEFDQAAFNAVLAALSRGEQQRKEFRENALQYTAEHHFDDRFTLLAEQLEQWMGQKA